MSAVPAEDVLRSARERWRAIDPLLPDPGSSADQGCGALDELGDPASPRAAVT